MSFRSLCRNFFTASSSPVLVASHPQSCSVSSRSLSSQSSHTATASKLKVVLNGETIQDIDLAQFEKTVPRHDGSSAPALKDRPTRGHIGFQELSRGDSHVLIRNARIKDLLVK